MALLKCCEEKYYFDSLLVRKRNLHSGQTRGRSGLSLAEWLGALSSSWSCWFFAFSHSALAHRQNITKKIIFYDALPCGNALWVKAMISWDNGSGLQANDARSVSPRDPSSPSLSLRQFICWCTFRGECCYGGPADACQSILARKTAAFVWRRASAESCVWG